MEPLRSLAALLLVCALVIGEGAIAAEAKGARPITDSEVRSKKVNCIEEINNGMWGSRCKASPINKENCALRCVSHACYQLLYADDPLEEGEVEFHRGRDFRMCVRRESKGLPLSLESLYD